MPPFAATLLSRWSQAGLRVLTSAIAASAAWYLAQHLLGHPYPIFAPIAAIVCLSPGVASRGQQAIGMLSGVAIGIVAGELLLLVLHADAIIRILVVSFVAMMAAASFGLTAVMVIQAGASAVIVVAAANLGAGLERVGDASTGAALGLLVSQVLLTPDPVAIIERHVRQVLLRVAAGLVASSRVLARADDAAMGAALDCFDAAHDSLVALDNAIQSARMIVRWTLRGRLASATVAATIARYDRPMIRVCAAALLYGEALRDAGRNGSPPPPALAPALLRAAAISRALAGDAGGDDDAGGGGDAADGNGESIAAIAGDRRWRRCADHLEVLLEALRALGAAHPSRI